MRVLDAFSGVAPELSCGGVTSHTQKDLRHATRGARGQILEGAQGTATLLNILECFVFHGKQLVVGKKERRSPKLCIRSPGPYRGGATSECAL